MQAQKYKTFNIEERRPSVLVVGNGLVYNPRFSWAELIKKVSRPEVDVSRYEKGNTAPNVIFQLVPNTILTLATSVTEDTKRHKIYSDVLGDVTYPENEKLKQLLTFPFDAILTTNYTYEIETAIMPKYRELSSASKRKYAATTGEKADTKYLLQTYNKLSPETPDIWHIHGELRSPSSMILSHDEYARYIHRIMQHNEKRGHAYVKFRQELKFESWVDYFLLGDVYILGLGMDYSEFDLWWLLGRRLREKSGCGKLVFYEPEKEDNYYKLLALKDAGIAVENCGVKIIDGSEYESFYLKAIDHIRKQLSDERK